MTRCDKCEEYRLNPLTPCRCKEFIVTCDDGENHTVHAVDDYFAALAFAKKFNENGDYGLMDETMTIEVNGRDGNIKKFYVSAEPDIHYSASEIK